MGSKRGVAHGRRLLGLDDAALLVEAHRRDQLDGVRQVGVGVAVRGRRVPAEVLRGLGVHQRRRVGAKVLDEDGLGVRALRRRSGCGGGGRWGGVEASGRGAEDSDEVEVEAAARAEERRGTCTPCIES